MTDVLGTVDIEALVRPATPPCVSLYLPTHRREPEAAQDPIRLRTLVAEAATQLADVGLRRTEIDRLLAPAVGLVNDPLFWKHQQEGLALLLAVDGGQSLRLPVAAPELVVVGERFHVHPLAELFEPEQRLLVLVLSQHSVRLFEADRWSVRERTVPGSPDGIDGILPDHEPQRTLQVHRSAAGPSDAAFFHGHGGVKDATTDLRRRYARRVDRALRRLLAGRHDPLVVAGTQPTTTDFRSLTSYGAVVGEIALDGDHVTSAQVHDAVRGRIDAQVAGTRRAACHRYAEAVGTCRTSTEVEAMGQAAMEGRVELLLVPPAVGYHDDPTARSHLDDALLHTLRHGGTVHVVPAAEADDHPVPTAVLRY